MAPLNIPQIHFLKLFKLTFNAVDFNFIMRIGEFGEKDEYHRNVTKHES